MPDPDKQRVLLKLSGEALMGSGGYGIDTGVLDRFAREACSVARSGTELAIVVGGGNIFRGVAGAAQGMDRVAADQMGMLATVINAVALAAAIDRAGGRGRVLSAIATDSVCEPFSRSTALAHMQAGSVVICAGGTGNPFFTTDTAAALRAAELDCTVLLKGTQVDGVYDSDPRTNPDARRYDRISYGEALARDLKVMDTAAFALARDNAIPIIVFDIHAPGALEAVLSGRARATVVSG